MKNAFVFLLAVSAVVLTACGATHDTMNRLTPEHVATEFFKAWERGDWKTLYSLAHPSFIEMLRLQKAASGGRVTGDEELFVGEFARVQGARRDLSLRSYAITSITPYRTGDTTVWVTALVNGRVRRIPLTLDGLSLKVDLLRVE